MFEKWIAMEHFYYTIMPTILFSLCIIAFIALLCSSYLWTKLGKRLFIICCVLIVTGGGYAAFQYHHHSELIYKTRYLSPATRYFARKFYYDMPYSSSEMNFYARAYLLNEFDALGFYQYETVTEPVEYLGKNEHLAFFKIDGKIFSNNLDSIEFSEEATQAERVGEYYSLKDERFATELGFVPKSKTYFMKYYIPQSMKDLRVNLQHVQSAKHQSQSIKGWLYR